MAIEFLQVAEAVAREKDIEKDQVLEVMEQAIEMACRRKYGMHLDVNAKIDRVDGAVITKRIRKVVKKVMEPVSKDEVRMALRENRDVEMQPALDTEGTPLEENDIHLTAKAAQKIDKNLGLGDTIENDIPQFDFGRVAAQAAKQVIFQKVRDVERQKEFAEYEGKVGEIVSGIVKRADYNGIQVDLGGADAFLPREEIIPRESYRTNDRIRAYIYKVQGESRGPQVLLSRTHPQFLVELFKEEVPEIGSGIIEIIGCAREAGARAKLAVKSQDNNLDPVGACVGIRGTRVKAITTELQGERIDIIEWQADPAMYLVQALAPAEVSKIVIDETENRIEVVVPEDKLSLAIGRRGQNVRLASILTGWDIDIMSEQEESDKRVNEFEAISQEFIKRLDIDETLTRLLIAEGFNTVDDLVMIPVEELGSIDGLDETVATELQRRAQNSIDEYSKEYTKLGVEKELLEMEGMNSNILMAIAKDGIKTLDDFAELASDELIELLPEGSLTSKQADTMIMEARKHWFNDEETGMVSEDESEQAQSAKLAIKVATTCAEFAKRLKGIDENAIALVAGKGFFTVEDVMYVGLTGLTDIEGIDETIAKNMKEKAEKTVEAYTKKCEKLGVEKELAELDGMKSGILMYVVENKIKTLDDFAELATDELLEMLPEETISQKKAESMIMEARKHWFDDEGEMVAVVASETETTTSASK
jgi:transcription termination/antitermination protein NusA